MPNPLISVLSIETKGRGVEAAQQGFRERVGLACLSQHQKGQGM